VGAGNGRALGQPSLHGRTGTRRRAADVICVWPGIIYWQIEQRAGNDWPKSTRLLTDDLPINAYLDKGFDSWLKRSSR
jgi:hypothetical protein